MNGMKYKLRAHYIIAAVVIIAALCGCAAKEAGQSAVSYSDAILTVEQPSEPQNVSGADAELSQDSPRNIYNFPIGDSDYLIYVEKGSHCLAIFGKDQFGYYTSEIARYRTATGKTKSMTPTGVFKVGKKEKWHRWPSGAYSAYTTKFYENARYGGLFIHSAVYAGMNFQSAYSVNIRGIGQNASSGCLRTCVEAAYFVYRYCEEGTPIYIVNGSPLGFKAPAVSFAAQYSDPAVAGIGFEPEGLIAIEGLSFSEERYKVEAGESVYIEPVYTPADTTYTACEWISSDQSVATARNGVITGVSAGTARITAVSLYDGEIAASFTIKVLVPSGDGAAGVYDFDYETYESSHTNDIRVTKEQLALIVKGRRVAIDDSVSRTLSALGDGYTLEEAESCAYNGMDKSFTYELSDGIVQIATVPSGAKRDNICELFVTTPSIATAQGVTVGMTASDMEKAYGTRFESELVAEYDSESAYVLISYYTEEQGSPSSPQIYFMLNPQTHVITGIGVYSAKNFG